MFVAHRKRLAILPAILVFPACLAIGGCQKPHYFELRRDGLREMSKGDFVPAANLLAQAEHARPREVENLHDLGVCHTMIARQKFAQLNQPAALRELNRAIDYYRRTLDVQPGHMGATAGLNTALELKGEFEQALAEAEWAAKNVGPSAEQQIFLAKELEERGDIDGALVSYRQGVAMEPRNPAAHVAIAKFLLRHNNESAAIHHLRVAYELDPRNEWVVEQLAMRGEIAPSNSPSGRS
jgi:tetratricopeptide (TPR) repeat protein